MKFDLPSTPRAVCLSLSVSMSSPSPVSCPHVRPDDISRWFRATRVTKDGPEHLASLLAPSLEPRLLCQRDAAPQPPQPIVDTAVGAGGLSSLSEAGCITPSEGPCLTNTRTGGNSLAALVAQITGRSRSVPALSRNEQKSLQCVPFVLQGSA